MHRHSNLLRRILPLALTLVIICVPGGLAYAQPQEGLPVDLVIPEEPSLDQQLEVLRALHESAIASIPKGGLLSGVRDMFGGGEEKATYTPVANVAVHAAESRGELVMTEGIYTVTDRGGVVHSMGHEVIVEPAGDVRPEGFEPAGGSPEGMPVSVTGRIETLGDDAVLRAVEIVPSALVTGVRIGRILELQEKWGEAVEVYETAASHGQLATRPLAAFAKFRAGAIAIEKLADEKRARNIYSAAWQTYAGEDHGKAIYDTWVETAEGDWEQIAVSKAIAPRLDRLNSGLLGYRIVDLFVRLAGGNKALGIVLLAVILRIAIFPLTRKQLVSQRRMAAIQPQIKELQKEHATDKQKFQEEFWALCKENNCNPLGGCLPMLVQMPILLFLYRGIREYIVQFDGTSLLWMGNLAQPDMILLVLYTVSMVAFQKVAAQSQPTADPQQQQQQQMMAYMMPIMFFFFFQGFPAAFILYWLASNLIYLAEQLIFVHGREGKPEPASAVSGEKKSGGFVTSMLDAAGRMGGDKPDEGPEKPVSYEQKRKQEKGRKRGRGR